MASVISLAANIHARASSSAGYKSGLNSERETPVSRSIGSTNSPGTPRLERMSQYQTCDCVVPIRSAKGFCPPAASQARLSASDIGALYPNLGGLQPKNLWGPNNRNFGSILPMSRQEIDPIEFGQRVRARRVELGMSQAELAEKSGQSQSNIGWIEQGKAKKPAKQVLPLVDALRTSTDWLLYGTGEKETGLRLLSDHEIVQIYRELGFEQQAEVSETFSKLAKSLKKRRKAG